MDVLKIAEKFGISPINATEFSTGGVNADYAFKIFTKNKIYLLKSVREELVKINENSANLVKHLAEHGFNKAPQNLLGQDKKAVIIENNINWTLQEFIESIHINPEDITQKSAKSLGETVSELHKAYLNDPSILKEPYIESEISYEAMFKQEQHEKMITALEELKNMDIPQEDLDLLEKYWKEYLETRENILEVLANVDENSFAKGIIHRDLNKGNILFNPKDESVLAIVDWEDVAYGNIIQDIAYTTSQYIANSNNLTEAKQNISSFINAYENKVSLSENEKSFIPMLVEILLVRATRWWGKRYLLLLKEKVSKKKLAKHQGGFRKTINNWLDNKSQYRELFNEIFV